MRKPMMGLIVLAALIPAIANAEPGFVNGSVNLRAGPGTEFPRIKKLKTGAKVEVRSCQGGFDWCDVSAGGARGWVSASYLDIAPHGKRGSLVSKHSEVQIPTANWNLDSYWDENYRGKNFNKQRDNYRGSGPKQENTPPRQTQSGPGGPGASKPGQESCSDNRGPGSQDCRSAQRPH